MHSPGIIISSVLRGPIYDFALGILPMRPRLLTLSGSAESAGSPWSVVAAPLGRGSLIPTNTPSSISHGRLVSLSSLLHVLPIWFRTTIAPEFFPRFRFVVDSQFCA
jgi:hypothetical protein